MEEIDISKLSSAVLARMKKGQPVRIREGSDMKLMVSMPTLKKMSRAFAKGKTITHKLSQAELEANAQMKGRGIFSDRYDKFLGKVKDATGIDAKKYSNKAFEYINPALKTGVSSLLTAGATALGTAQPELIPYLPGGVVAGSYLANDVIDNPRSYGLGLYASGRGMYDSEGTFHPSPNQINRFNYNKMKQKGEGLYAQRNMKGRGTKLLDQKFTGNDVVKFFRDDIPNAIQGKGRKIPQTAGGGQRRRNNPPVEIGGLGRGGTLVSPFAQHPALQSQPYSVNFQWATTLPEKYSTFHNGLH